MGADPVAYAIARASHAHPPEIDAFSVRKEAKAHGTGRRIEGCFRGGAHVVVVEDVITTGKSTRETINCVEEAGGKVVGIGALVDRSGGQVDFGMPKASLVTLNVEPYDPDDCPLCKQRTPAVKPGSRPGTSRAAQKS